MIAAEFFALEGARAYWLLQASVPHGLLGIAPGGADREGAVLLDLRVDRGMIAEIAPAASGRDAGGMPCVDLQRRQLWPAPAHSDSARLPALLRSLAATVSSLSEAVPKPIWGMLWPSLRRIVGIVMI